MKRFAFVAMLALAGCNQAQVQTVGPTLLKVVDSVQAATIVACKFVPTATTIANIVSAGSTAGPSVMANDVCTAINAMPLAAVTSATAPAMLINGKPVAIEGHRI